MPRLKNPAHETFCQEYVRTGSYAEAWRKATGGDATHSDANGAKWAVKGSIPDRIEEIQNQNEKRSDISKDEAIKLVCQIIKAPPKDAAVDHPLCEIKMSKAGEYYAFPDKLGALAKLGSWCGWDKGTEAENKIADALVDDDISASRAKKRLARK